MTTKKKSMRKQVKKQVNYVKSQKGVRFYIIAKKTSDILGSFWTFLAAVSFCLLWLFSGPYYNYSNTWQLVINTTTTIITFLMVFIIQNTQNRDTQILNLKIDELIKSQGAADNKFLDLEDFSEEELKELREKYKELCNRRTDK